MIEPIRVVRGGRLRPHEETARHGSHYTAISQLQASLNAQSEVTNYTYDAAGNRMATSDPLSVETTEEYDDLNRMKRTLQDVGGIDAEIQYSYDAMGNLTEVIDTIAPGKQIDGCFWIMQVCCVDSMLEGKCYVNAMMIAAVRVVKIAQKH